MSDSEHPETPPEETDSKLEKADLRSLFNASQKSDADTAPSDDETSLLKRLAAQQGGLRPGRGKPDRPEEETDDDDDFFADSVDKPGDEALDELEDLLELDETEDETELADLTALLTDSSDDEKSDEAESDDEEVEADDDADSDGEALDELEDLLELDETEDETELADLTALLTDSSDDEKSDEEEGEDSESEEIPQPESEKAPEPEPAEEPQKAPESEPATVEKPESPPEIVETEEAASPPEIAESEESEAPPVIYRYRIAAVLPPDLQMKINAARQNIGIPIAQTGIFELAGSFKTQNLETVQSAVQAWVQEHLPLDLTLDNVEARVIGKQRYRAAWTLTPAEPLIKAGEALWNTLEPHVEEAQKIPVTASLKVCDPTPARDFPALIRELQMAFEPYTWKLQAVEILQVDEKDLDQRWEVVQKYTTRK